MKNTNLIIGKANTGKTKGVLFNETKRLIENKESLFILDSRDEYYRTFGKELKDNGYNVFTINFNDVTKSNGFNPLELPYKLYKEGKKDDALDMIKNFAYETCKEKNQMDPFWTNSASDYLTGLILVLFKNAKADEINLGSLTMLLNQCETEYEENKTYMSKYLENVDILDNIYIALSGTTFAPYETKASILSVLKQKFNSIVMKENLLNLLSINDIKLDEIDEKTAIFVIGKNEMANVLINQLYYIVKNKKLSFNFILEEINNYTTISSLEDMIKDATYNNMKIYVTTRDKETFKENYNSSIDSQFETIVEPSEKEILIEFGNYDEYPKLSKQKHNYFNFKEYMNDKYGDNKIELVDGIDI